jgi:hypothetical protein
MLRSAVPLVLLAGCGAGDTPQAATQAPSAPAQPSAQAGPAPPVRDACTLLPAATAASALGTGAVTASPRTDPRLGASCTYSETSPSGLGAAPLLTVEVSARRDAADARSQVDRSGGSPVAGIGDDARVSAPGALSTAVFLARGATFVVLFSLHQGVTAEQILPLAHTVAAAL